MASNNPPDVIVELTRAEAEFILRNADVNIGQALDGLQNDEYSEATARKLVELMEQFKAIKAAVKRGLKSS